MNVLLGLILSMVFKLVFTILYYQRSSLKADVVTSVVKYNPLMPSVTSYSKLMISVGGLNLTTLGATSEFKKTCIHMLVKTSLQAVHRINAWYSWSLEILEKIYYIDN